jgi:hypothetical protein
MLQLLFCFPLSSTTQPLEHLAYTLHDNSFNKKMTDSRLSSIQETEDDDVFDLYDDNQVSFSVFFVAFVLKTLVYELLIPKSNVRLWQSCHLNVYLMSPELIRLIDFD